MFAGFGLAFLHKFLMKAPWACGPRTSNSRPTGDGSGKGLVGGRIGGELSPELLGVGYIIGPRIASIMMAGGVLAYLVLVPMMMLFGSSLVEPLAPATDKLIRDMAVKDIRDNYVVYIGAGAVATGGIISMFQALPLIFALDCAGVRDLRREHAGGKGESGVPRTERDMPMWVVVFGSLGLVAALAGTPALGLGFSLKGLMGATLIVLFGFLFVTVSSRLTGEIGSSSNPDLRHDRGHAAADVPGVPRIRPRGQGGGANRADRGGRGVHRGLERRHDVAGPEDRLPGRRHAALTSKSRS